MVLLLFFNPFLLPPMKESIQPVQYPQGLVLGECPATGLLTQGLCAHKQRQEICPRRFSLDNLLLISSQFLEQRRDEKLKGQEIR
jgi:hypothetical protein